MTWPGFYAIGGAWLFLLVGPLVLLYFLKLKRPRQEVPSLVLWRQVLNDNRVNSPLQKFKRNLLLLLQLLLLLAIILAAMQPYLRGNVADSQRLPILIDNSASMAALDRAGGISRLEAAKQQVRTMIDGLGSDQQIALISFSRGARKLADFTNGKRTLRQALDALEVDDLPSDIEDALRVTAAMGQTQPFDRVLLLSDGNFPSRTNLALPFRLEYQQLDGAGPNFGVTLFNARRAGHHAWDVFVVIEGSRNIGAAPATVSATLELYQDGQLLATESNLVLSQNQSQRLMFPVQATAATSLQVKLKTDAFDALASDNVAYLDLQPARPLWAYVPSSLVWHRLALGNIPDVRIFPEDGQEITSETAFDLVISDRTDDLNLAARARLFIDVMPEELTALLMTKNEVGQVIDWQRNEELLRYVELSKLYFEPQPMWQPNIGDAELENLGYEVVVYGQYGPVLLRRRTDSDLSYFQLFHIDRSTLDRMPVDFVILVQNLVNLAMQRAGLAETQGQATGVLSPLKVSPQTTYRVRPPQGTSRSVDSDEQAMLAGIAAPHVGQYVIEESGIGGASVAQIGASLLSAHESSLLAEPTVEFKEQIVQANAGVAKTDYSYWRALLLAAFVVLMLEWWYFQRKPGGYR